MKKILLVIIVLVSFVTATGCNKPDAEVLSILIPSGTPSLVAARMMEYSKNKNHQYQNIYIDYEIVNGSDPLIAAFTSKSHDIIFAPTNLGAAMYRSNGHYQLASVIVWGNSFVVTKGSNTLNTIEDLVGKKIIAFGQNATPDIVLKTILEENGILNQVEIEYVADVTTATSLFLTGSADYILSAEPSISKLRLNHSLQTLDLQEEWNKVTGYTGYPQVGVFILQDTINANQAKIATYLSVLEQEISFMKSHPEEYALIAVMADESFELVGVSAIADSIPNSNYRYVSALNAKVECINYFTILLQKNPNLIGGGLPNDEFYYQGEG
jgi:NitT/TauT family transport system substrate-binding protein